MPVAEVQELEHDLEVDRHEGLALTSAVFGYASVCWLDGEIDIVTAPRLVDELNRLIDGGVDHLVIDLSHVTFFGAAAVNGLIGVDQRLAPHGAMTLRGASSLVVRILGLCGLGTLDDEASTWRRR